MDTPAQECWAYENMGTCSGGPIQNEETFFSLTYHERLPRGPWVPLLFLLGAKSVFDCS